MKLEYGRANRTGHTGTVGAFVLRSPPNRLRVDAPASMKDRECRSRARKGLLEAGGHLGASEGGRGSGAPVGGG